MSSPTNKSRKNKKSKRVLKRNKGNDDDDNSSVDSNGNIRNLIDYDYMSESNCDSEQEDEQEPEYTSETDTASERSFKISSRGCRGRGVACKTLPRQVPPRQVPPRKAAVDARSKVNKIITKEMSSKKTSSTRLTPSKRKRHTGKLEIKRSYKRITPPSKKSSEADDEEELEDKDEESDETEEELEESCDETEDEEESCDETEEEEEEEEEDESSDETEDDSEDIEYSDDETVNAKNINSKIEGILLALGNSPPKDEIMRPKKYNMKKEPESVKKFVKLLTLPIEDNTLDQQIDQFKALTDTKQKELISALENRPAVNDSGVDLMLKILTLKLAPDVQAMILSKYNSLQTLEKSSNEYFKLRAWLDKVVSIPFGVYKDIAVRLEDGSDKCAEFMKNAKKCLDDAVYGQDESKLQIMQYISTKIVNPEHRGLSLLLVGPAGIGKTSLIKNGIAKALGWPFQFISLGGDSDASTYTGHQMVYESSHCGKIVNSLIASKSMSTVLMFDEIDKISQTPKGEEIMNLLIHLTDPVQNADFEDKYLSGVPIDLSKVMFIFSANDINKIDRILLDRMMVIDLKGYDLKQKTTIAEHYLLPAALKDVNLTERISISKDILTYIIKEYANEESGVRELKRSIEQITQKINMLRMFNSPELPFHIKDFSLPFIVKTDHIKLFIKKKENSDEPPPGLYV
jgi:ATP-dependent Lon protease